MKFRFAITAALLPVFSAAAQVSTPSTARSIAAYPVQHPITVDGHLDESEWRDAPLATYFVQSEPHTGSLGTEKTEVRVLFDGEKLYIGAYLHDSEPGRLIVNDLRKDFAEDQQDDFEVILDTFHDRTNGYVFITNVEGARSDRQVANEGREVNASWDGMWSVKTNRAPDGWVVEMAIPFKTLRFDFADAPKWGINFARRIRRKNEIDFWSPVPRAFGLARVSLAGELTGISHEGTSHDLRVKPYGATRSIRETGGPSFKSTSDGGLDVKYGVTQGLTLDLTVNPDFAQVESDEQTVNLTQFSQFFPEKREFFLENSGIFYVGDAARNTRVSLPLTSDEDMVLFFSRRIGLNAAGRQLTIPAGLRLTGNIGSVNVGLLSMNTEKTSTTPGSQYSVVRIRRNLFTGTDVGFIVLDREGTSEGSDWNRIGGIDGNARLPGNWDWNSYAVMSRKPGISGGQYTYRSTVNHEGNFFHAKAGVLEVGDGFSDDLGYFRRTNTRKYLIDTGVRPRPAWLAPLHVREMHPHIVWAYYEDLDGQMTAKSLHSGYTFFLSDGGYFEGSVNPNYQRIDKPFTIDKAAAPIPAGGYGWTTYQLRGTTNQSRRLSLQYTLITGGLWSGTQVSEQFTLGVRPSVHFNGTLGVNHTAATLDGPDGKFDALLWTARMNYSFTTNMFFDALTQYDPRERLFNANMRFNLIHHPLSDLFVVVNHQRIATPDTPDIKPGVGVIVKYTQMFSLMTSYRAAVFPAPNQPIEFREFPEPDIEIGGALLHTLYSEVCGTDVHLHHGRLSGVPYPIIPGHVSVGVVAKLRGSVKTVIGDALREGDVVTFLDVNETCNSCYYCLIANEPTRCPSRRVYGITYSANDGLLGGWSQAIYMKPGVKMIHFPADLSAETFIGGGCGLVTALHAIDLAQIRLDESVAVLGAGPVGQSVVALASLSGAGEIVAVDGVQDRLAFAREMGATNTIDIAVSRADRLEQSRRMTRGHGFDVVIEASGNPDAVSEALDLVRDGGRVIVCGHYTDNGSVEIHPHWQINRKHVTVRGCWGSRYEHFHRGVDIAARFGKIKPWSRMASRSYPLDEVATALDAVANRSAVKAVVRISH